MRPANLGDVLGYLRRLTDAQVARDVTDAELLERFCRRREESAFTMLLQRHGPMVLAVCRRVLGDVHAAEDAFQATFLVLVRKPGSIRKQASLASWLYGVAQRVATRARAQAARRRCQERRPRPMPPREPSDTKTLPELRAVLDEELALLPEKYRAPLVLCYLEAKTQEQAARELRCPRTSLTSRLARARELLRERLSRRGVTVPSGVVAALLVREATQAAVPTMLTITTVRAALLIAGGRAVAGFVSQQALGLAEGTLKTMSATKLKTGLALLVLSVLAAGSGLATYHTVTSEQSAVQEASAGQRPEAEAKRSPLDGERQARLDRYGDPLPARAIQRLGTVRFRHGDQVYAVAYAPDGKTIASGGLGTIRLWEAATGKPLATLSGHKTHVFSLMFSKDGSRLLSAGGEGTDQNADGKVILWDVASRRPMFTVDHKGSWVRAAALSSDGLRIAMACDDGTLLLLDADTGRELHSLGQPRRFVNTVAFSPDGRTVAAAGGDNSIQIWDTATGQKQTRLMDAGRLRTLAFSPDGKILASAHDGPQWQDDGVIYLWDLATGKQRHSLRAHKEMILAVAFSPDNQYLASSGLYGLVLLWDAATGKQLRKYQAPESWVHGVAFAPDGRTLVCGSTIGRIQVWDVATAEERLVFDEHAAGVADIDLSPDGKQIATAGSRDRTVRLWDIGTGRPIRILRGFEREVYVARFAPDGKRLVTSGGDGVVRIWSLASGTEERRLTAPGDNWDARAAFSPSGKFLATGHVQLIRLWDPATGKEIRQLTGHEGYVIDLAFSPNEHFLASAAHGYSDGTELHEDRSVRVWDVAQGMELERISQLYPDHLAFRADGRVLVWLNQGRICRRDFLIGQDLPDNGNENATTFALSADGWWLAKAQTGGLILILEETTGKEVLRFQATPAGVHKLIWAADGRTLVSANGDATVLIWDLSPSGRSLRQAGQKGDQALELQQAWEDLKSPDAVRAYRAVWLLASAGDTAVNLFERCLRPTVSDARTERIGRLVRDLDHEDFQRREAASRQLALLGPEATSALVRALINNPSLELRNRAKAILKQIPATPKAASADELQTGRALVVLERLGIPKAFELLKKLAKGAPEARLTEEAKASLQRLARRNAKP